MQTFDMLVLIDLEPEEGLGRLAATMSRFTESKTKLGRQWDTFFDEIATFQKRLGPFIVDAEPFVDFQPFEDDRQFATSALDLLRVVSQVASYFRKGAIKASPKLAFLLGDMEMWTERNFPALEKMLMSADSSVATLDQSEELGHLLARLTKLNRVLEKYEREELIEFCKANERFAEALKLYVAETRSSSIDIYDDSVALIAASIEPKIVAIRDHAEELSKSYDSINVVHMLLLQIKRHMEESLTLFQRLQWLRPK